MVEMEVPADFEEVVGDDMIKSIVPMVMTD